MLSLANYTTGYSALLHDFDQSWLTLETEHFQIHYPQPLTTTANKVASLSQSIHDQVTAYFDSQPTQKTHIIITDNNDFPNGSATIFPANQILIHAMPPTTISGLEDYHDWLALVLLHEYVHIVHLDMTGGLPGLLRNIFGRHRLLFFNQYQPTWIIEGIATLQETDIVQGIGRGQSSYFRALMRNEVQQGIKSLNTVNQPLISWPSGTTRYLYGVYFLQFLAERYGEQTFKKFSQTYSRIPLPFLLNITRHQLYEKDFYNDWDEFTQYLHATFDPEIATITANGLRVGDPLTQQGNQTGYSRADPVGNLYFIANDLIERTRLKRYSPATQTIDTITRVFGSQFDLHPQAGIVIAQRDVYRNVKNYFDLFHIDPNTGQTTQLTRAQRYLVATWSPDAQQIAAIKYQASRFSLDLLTQHGEYIQTLWQASDDTAIGSLDWSPTQALLVASVWRPKRGWNLEHYDINTAQWTPLTATSHIEAQAQFTPAGKAIVFTADYDKTYNIYRYQLATHALEQLTNVTSAAFYPTVHSSSNTLYYAGLRQQGFDLFHLPIHPTSPPVLPKQLTEPLALPSTSLTTPATSTATEEPNLNLQPTPYRAISHLTPQYWEPSIIINNTGVQIGFNTSLRDPLRKHIITTTLDYNVTHNMSEGSLSYRYDGLYPVLSLTASRNNFFEFTDPLLVQQIDAIALNSLFPVRYQARTHNFIANAQYQHRQFFFDRSNFHPEFANSLNANEFSSSLVGVATTLNTTYQKPLTAAASQGIQAKAIAEQVFLTDQFTRLSRTARLALSAYTPPFNHHVFSANISLGKTTATAPFRFNANGATLAQPTSVFFGIKSGLFRGYPSQLTALAGTRFEYLSAAWHFPISLIESGIMLPPIGINFIKGKLFATALHTWNQSSSSRPILKSMGIEFTLNTTYGYRIPNRISFGLARGLDQFGETQSYFNYILRFF